MLFEVQTATLTTLVRLMYVSQTIVPSRTSLGSVFTSADRTVMSDPFRAGSVTSIPMTFEISESIEASRAARRIALMLSAVIFGVLAAVQDVLA